MESMGEKITLKLGFSKKQYLKQSSSMIPDGKIVLTPDSESRMCVHCS